MPGRRARPTWVVDVAMALLSVCAGIALLGLLELGLRAFGVGDRDPADSPLKYQRIALPIMGERVRPDGIPVLVPVDRRLPYQALLRDRPESGIRILAFGGSATAGLGYSPNLTFSRYLEQMLREAGVQGPVEVLNLGIVALSSNQVRGLIEDASARYDADLIVVYSGNNEFLEIHAEKYFRNQAGWTDRAMFALRNANLVRLLDRAVRSPNAVLPLAEQSVSNDDLRLTEEVLVSEVATSPDEIEAIVDRYESNLDAIVHAAKAHETPVLLMTVASNWRWRGMLDLPDDWMAELVGSPADAGPSIYQRARMELDRRLATAPPAERSELLYKRATVAERLGDVEVARADFRAAMNSDPHLRRALSVMNDRIRRVADRQAIPIIDSVEILSRESVGGIIGFETFYDYVHFSPRGALLLAGALFEKTVELDLVSADKSFSWRSFMADELERLAGVKADDLKVERWLGFGSDPGRLTDRDLWKYERMVRSLSDRIEEDPNDALARVYRGNARYFELDGGAAAEADWQAALALWPDSADVQGNLDRLGTEARP